MTADPAGIGRRAASGEPVSRDELLALAEHPDPEQVWRAADEVRRVRHGTRFSLCAIVNARSGGCTEDCRFCAQSARHRTGAPRYDFVDEEHAVALARRLDAHGVRRFSFVASGRGPDTAFLQRLAGLAQRVRQASRLSLCASLGLLDAVQAETIAAMGVRRYHCNLETAAAFFPSVCSTHGWREKVATLTRAREAGLELCSGAIVGLGETWPHRVDLALSLRRLGIRSIPVNLLTPIDGTPLAGAAPPSLEEALTAVALFRLANPDAVVRMAGGRQQYGAEQYRFFRAGANGAIVGHYLTTRGTELAEDLEAIAGLGYRLGRAEKRREASR